MSVSPGLFDWIVPDQLAACVNPRLVPRALEALAAHRIDLVINLDEQPTADVLKPLGMREVHLPVRDFTAPTQAQLEQGVTSISHALASGQRVAVHCAAGLGRTGSLLAAYLVAEGFAPAEAIARVRALRPGSIETADQERAVAEFAAQPRSCITCSIENKANVINTHSLLRHTTWDWRHRLEG